MEEWELHAGFNPNNLMNFGIALSFVAHTPKNLGARFASKMKGFLLAIKLIEDEMR